MKPNEGGYAILLKEQESDYETAMEYVAELKVEVETKRSLIAELQAGLDQAEGRVAELEGVLEFYADPETYFAIGFFPDHPCGEFDEDFEELSGELGHPDGTSWFKPGKRARQAISGDGSRIMDVVKAARLVAEGRATEVGTTPLRMNNLREALDRLDGKEPTP